MHIELQRVGRHAILSFLSEKHKIPALGLNDIEEMSRLLSLLKSDDSIRSLSIESHSDKIFLAGGDLQEFATLDTSEKGRAMAVSMRNLLSEMENLPIPVIMVISGDVYGGGCEMILAGDIRVAREGVRFSFSQGKFGITTGWGGATRLVNLVGRGTASLMLLSGCSISAEEAKDIHLIDIVVSEKDLQSKVNEIRNQIERLSPKAVASMKRVLFIAERQGFDQALKFELEAFSKLWASEEHLEGLSAFFEKRRPRWAYGDDRAK